ncbi:hypothetical protein ACMAZF_04235 [Psychrobium sp. nBUS_13]|uniref:hypothetical protein n=1 Tax=Psychrobium sp. nBUS_13 TaxID=3395319 RepID=UPI003EC10E71
MKLLAKLLQQYGEDAQLKNNHVHVHFSRFVSKLTIKKDIATNRLVYSYNQFGDFIGIIMFCVMAGTYMNKGDFTYAMFCTGLALALATSCIIKEIKVTAIKQQVNTLLEKYPEILTTKLQRLTPYSVSSR